MINETTEGLNAPTEKVTYTRKKRTLDRFAGRAPKKWSRINL